MTDTATMTIPAASPQRWGTLEEEELACLGCGVAVADPAPASVEMFTPRGLKDRLGRGTLPAPVEMTRCPECQRHAATASDLATRHPSIAARLGSYAVARFEGVVRACAILGKPVPEKEVDLWLAVQHLAAAGDQAAYSTRVAPLSDADWQPGQCVVNPWGHLRREQHDALREARVRMVAAQLRRDARPTIECPDGRGCLMCGVGGLPVSEVGRSGTQRPWRRWTVDVASLGGTRRHRIQGHICFRCAEAVEQVGELSQAAMERAYRQARGSGCRVPVVGHAVSAHRDGSNSTPWAHMDGLVSPATDPRLQEAGP